MCFSLELSPHMLSWKNRKGLSSGDVSDVMHGAGIGGAHAGKAFVTLLCLTYCAPLMSPRIALSPTTAKALTAPLQKKYFAHHCSCALSHSAGKAAHPKGWTSELAAYGV